MAGGDCPLLKYIERTEELARGQWTLLLYRHDCPHCRQQLPYYEQLARSGDSEGHRVALVEVPPYGEDDPPPSPCQRRFLNTEREWFVAVPAEVQLMNGAVTAVRDREELDGRILMK